MKEFKVSSLSEYVHHIEKIAPFGDYWFRGVAKSSYLPIPKLIWKNAIKTEGSLEHSFLVSYKPYTENQLLNSWEVFALMQHHGIPTRLLDWSESALVALYFALTSEPSSTSYRVVWVMNPYSLNEETIGDSAIYCPAVIRDKNIVNGDKECNLDSYLPPNLEPDSALVRPSYPIAIHSSRNIRRASSQQGCFTVHGKDLHAISTYLSKDQDFHMIKVDARTKKKRIALLRSLSSLGIDEEFIYQDLDSLSQKINREHRL